MDKTRLNSALAAFAALGAVAWFSLEGSMRAAVLVFLAGLAVKSLIAYKRGS